MIDPTIKSDASVAVWMNRSGQVAYLGGKISGAVGIYVGQNGASAPVYTIPAQFTRGPVEMHNVLDPLRNIHLNDQGALYFEGDFFNLPAQPADPEISFGGLVQGRLSGSLPDLMVTDGTLNNGDFQSLGEHVENNYGQVLCVVSISDGVGLYYRLIKATTGGAEILTDTRAGPFLELTAAGGGSLAINDAGSIVFSATFKDSSGARQSGLFSGVDPVNDKIIATGDPLFDSTVSGLSFNRVGFNNHGQLALLVTLKSGVALLVRADPADDSTRVEWTNPGGGSFDAPANWHPVNGDPPRVPVKTTTLNDTAVFDLPASYSVNAGGEHAERLIVKDGDVKFLSGAIRVDALSFDNPSTIIDNARLTLENGVTVTNNHAVVGLAAAARVDVMLGGSWKSSGSLRVGGHGEGILEIDSLGTVISAESRVGTDAEGRVVVGSEGSWTTGNIAIGAGGRGELAITNGGSVDSEKAYIGQAPGAVSGLGNKVVVQGASSRWETIFLSVGGAASGRLEVRDGGLASTIDLKVAESPGVSGSIVVGGVGPNSAPATVSVSSLEIGVSGAGEVLVSDGGLVDATSGSVEVGGEGDAAITVTGSNTVGLIASTLLLGDGTLLIGSQTRHGHGRMTIDGGGVVDVSAGLSVVARGTPGIPSEVTLVGSASEWDAGDLIVGGAGVNSGQAIVTLVDGHVTAGECTLGQGGVVRGFGSLDVNRRVLNGGTISPGLSPGTLTIKGNFEQQPGGRLIIEIGGTNSADYDHLIVTNAATLDGNLTIRCINGFAPRAGDRFDFFTVGGQVSGAFAGIEVQNVAPGFQFAVATNGALVSMTALNDGVFVAPLPGQIVVSNALTIGGITYLPYAIQATNDCTVVEPSGPVRRQGQELLQTLGERVDPGCFGASANASGLLVLGALPPGDYQFRFVIDGVAVASTLFTVPPGTGEVLDFARTPGDELDIQINGLAGVRYAIQESVDLQEWVDVPVHTGDFLGPFHVFEPIPKGSKGGFFRVRIQ